MTRNKAEKILINLQVDILQENWSTQKIINAIFKAQILVKKKLKIGGLK